LDYNQRLSKFEIAKISKKMKKNPVPYSLRSHYPIIQIILISARARIFPTGSPNAKIFFNFGWPKRKRGEGEDTIAARLVKRRRVCEAGWVPRRIQV
jgi:hypothetical protein